MRRGSGQQRAAPTGSAPAIPPAATLNCGREAKSYAASFKITRILCQCYNVSYCVLLFQSRYHMHAMLGWRSCTFTSDWTAEQRLRCTGAEQLPTLLTEDLHSMSGSGNLQTWMHDPGWMDTLAIVKPSSGLTMYCARYPTPIGTGFFMHCMAADASSAVSFY